MNDYKQPPPPPAQKVYGFCVHDIIKDAMYEMPLSSRQTTPPIAYSVYEYDR